MAKKDKVTVTLTISRKNWKLMCKNAPKSSEFAESFARAQVESKNTLPFGFHS